MTINSRTLKDWARGAYDKIALFAALFGLLASLIALIIMVGRERKTQETLTPAPAVPNRRADPGVLERLDDLDAAIERQFDPPRLALWTNRLMVAEPRVRCAGCGRPIPADAELCPFATCKTNQPAASAVRARDRDLDGMPDDWEIAHGLNPGLDDAQGDADGDGFTNVEEYRAQTAPRDAAGHPPYTDKLRIVKIEPLPMPLTFQGVQRLGANDVRFLIKNRRTHRDVYAKIGDIVDGYTVAGFQEKTNRVSKGTFHVNDDVSELVLTRNGKPTVLVKGRENQGELVAELVFLADDSTFSVKKGDLLTLKNIAYKMVDITKTAVIVAPVGSGTETPLQWQSKTDAAP